MKSSKTNTEKRKSSSIGLIRRFAVYYKKYIPTLSLDLFCAALTTLCELALPLIVRKITDVASTDISKLSVSLILICAGIYVALKIIDTAAYYYMSSVGHIMG
ncbi:MAG: ABC transporter ATP-binding protein, partial [Clostridia bacterium]|nr:ABC transporter ATP-binding protein [Clostridia bacterium]